MSSAESSSAESAAPKWPSPTLMSGVWRVMILYNNTTYASYVICLKPSLINVCNLLFVSIINYFRHILWALSQGRIYRPSEVVQIAWNMRNVLNRKKDHISNFYDFYFSSYGKNWVRHKIFNDVTSRKIILSFLVKITLIWW